MTEQWLPNAGLEVHRDGPVAVLTLNRPDRRNALSAELLVALGNARTLLTEPELRAIVITGAGDAAFCAGADLKERARMTLDDTRQQLRAYRQELGWLEDSPLPVIAALNGAALGGGLELALMCDLRIAVPSAVFGFPETSLGVIPGAGGTQRLPRVIGTARAKELILLGTRLNAEQALQIGLVHRLATSTATLLSETLEWIAPILRGAPIAQAAALEAIDAATFLSLSDGLAHELTCYERCLASEDRDEALRAFAEKRKPQFKGQ